MKLNALPFLVGVVLLGAVAPSPPAAAQAAPPAVPTGDSGWHEVRHVMDLDRLPADAAWVRISSRSAGMLDFLAEKREVRGIRCRGIEDLRAANVKSLATLPKLELLDVTGCYWSGEEPSFDVFSALPALKRLRVDLNPMLANAYGSEAPRPFTEARLPALAKLSARGVAIELGEWGWDEAEFNIVMNTLPDLAGISLSYATDAMLKRLAEAPKLRSLSVRSLSKSDVGLAYLARGARLETLAIEGEIIEEQHLHQIARMSTLRTVHITGRAGVGLREGLKRLAALTNLRELHLAGLEVDQGSYSDLVSLAELPVLDYLRLGRSVFDDAPAEVAFHLPMFAKARRIEVSLAYLYVRELPQPEWINPAAPAGVETLCLRTDHVDPTDINVEEVARVLAAYPSLKTLELRLQDDTADDDGSRSLMEQTARLLQVALPNLKVVFVG